jgi:hypothetical protein
VFTICMQNVSNSRSAAKWKIIIYNGLLWHAQ